MEEQKQIFNCISCNRDENIVPLVAITYSQTSTWICTQCLPTLIHDPQKLEDKFKDMSVDNPPKPLN
ncbi:MAG: hypothetical protein ABFS12_08700 [Bacteroidota bacterium]